MPHAVYKRKHEHVIIDVLTVTLNITTYAYSMIILFWFGNWFNLSEKMISGVATAATNLIK